MVDPFHSKRFLRACGIVLFMFLLIPTGYIVCVQHDANFATVEAGEVYRSSRVPPGQLAELVEKYGIKSVLNLEGARPNKSWYQAEVLLLDRLGVRRYDFRLSATEMVTPERVSELLDIVRNASKPLLVHCRDGADRTGLVAALYEAKIVGRDKEDAYKQLSLRYGHFKYLWSGTRKMDDTFWTIVEPPAAVSK